MVLVIKMETRPFDGAGPMPYPGIVGHLIVACGKGDLRELFGHLPDFTTEFLPLEPDSAWPVLERGSLAILDQAYFETLPEGAKRAAMAGPLLLLIEASLPPETISAYRQAGIRLFYFLPKDVFNQENLLCLARVMADQAKLSARLDSYISDSFRDIIDTALLQSQKAEIEELNAKLQVISRVDSLTSLLNRRALLEAFDQEKRRALRHRWRLRHSGPAGETLSEPSPATDFLHETKGSLREHIGNFACLIVDIDFFKRVNDGYGHLTGDMVLRDIGEIMKREGIFRDTDIKGRYGGEEFIVLLPETNAANSLIPAERLRETVKSTVFESDDGRTFSVTISVGIAEFLPEELSCDEMIKRADSALYYAKEHGRDQICLFENLHQCYEH
jgi:diguanylate cyclase (GGDEF)-like protein